MMKVFQILFLTLTTLNGISQSEQINQVKRLIAEEQYDKGLEIINGLISHHTDNAVYYYKAYCQQQKKFFDSAIVSATLALKLTSRTDSLYGSILILRALCFAYAGKLDSAILDNEILIKQFPNNLSYLLNMSYLYGENQRLTDCINVLQVALALDSTNIYVLNNLSYYNNEGKNYNASIKYATKGLSLTNDSVWVASLLNNLGFAQAKTISAAKGIETINHSISIRPSNPYAYFNLGLIYLDIKDVEKACQNFKTARQLGGINMTTEYLNKYCN
jgi:tetratricopeptide (TPR) repeat protein